MKIAFENILKSVSGLSEKQQSFVIKQLKTINNTITGLIAHNDSLKRQLTGVNEKQYNEVLYKALELLKILGFNEFTFNSFNPEFLNWFIENTTTIAKFNPKLMNFYLLNSMQQAFFIAYAENDGAVPKYNQVKKIMLTFDETIKQYEDELKINLPDLINKIDGKN